MENVEQAQVLEDELRQMEQVHVLNEAMRTAAPVVRNPIGQRLMEQFCASFAGRVLEKLDELGYEIRKKAPAKRATTAAKKTTR